MRLRISSLLNKSDSMVYGVDFFDDVCVREGEVIGGIKACLNLLRKEH